MTVRGSPPIRVMLVEDHPMIRRGLRGLLGEQRDLVVVGESTTARAAVAAAGALQPDVVIVPIRLGGHMGGVELCRSLAAVSGARTIVYTAFTGPDDVRAAILAGVDGMVSKRVGDAELVASVRAVAAGRRTWLLDEAPPDPAPAALSTARLTGRERDILDLMLRRHTNRRIAAELTIEVSTVKTHVRNILRKLGIDSRRALFNR